MFIVPMKLSEKPVTVTARVPKALVKPLAVQPQSLKEGGFMMQGQNSSEQQSRQGSDGPTTGRWAV